MVDMKSKNIYKLLEQSQNDGFTFDNLSCITGVQSELISRCANGDKLTHEETMLLGKVLNLLELLYMVDIESDAYLQDTVVALEHFYKLPRHVIARYMGLNIAEFEQFLQTPQTYPNSFFLLTKLMHFRNILMQRRD